MDLMSEKFDQVVGAILAMQGEVLEASKNSINPHFKSRYSDLTAVMDTLRDPMQKNGLCVVQSTHLVEGNEMVLRTMLLHKSGQWIASEYPIRAKDNLNPQAVGGAITYARRYSLAALTGLVQADDDGHEASKTRVTEKPKVAVLEDRKITGPELEKMMDLIGTDERLYSSVREWIKKLGFNEFIEINISTYKKIVKHLSERKNAAA